MRKCCMYIPWVHDVVWRCMKEPPRWSKIILDLVSASMGDQLGTHGFEFHNERKMGDTYFLEKQKERNVASRELRYLKVHGRKLWCVVFIEHSPLLRMYSIYIYPLNGFPLSFNSSGAESGAWHCSIKFWCVGRGACQHLQKPLSKMSVCVMDLLADSPLSLQTLSIWCGRDE